MTGQQLKNYRRRMKMNREALAFWLGVDPNTAFRWERGIQRVPDAVEVVLKSTPRPREGWKWMDDLGVRDEVLEHGNTTGPESKSDLLRWRGKKMDRVMAEASFRQLCDGSSYPQNEVGELPDAHPLGQEG